MKKEYGWKTRGQRLYDNKSGDRKNKRITVISAYSNQTKQLIAPMYFEGNTDAEIFNQWIEKFLIPELKALKDNYYDSHQRGVLKMQHSC